MIRVEDNPIYQLQLAYQDGLVTPFNESDSAFLDIISDDYGVNLVFSGETELDTDYLETIIIFKIPEDLDEGSSRYVLNHITDSEALDGFYDQDISMTEMLMTGEYSNNVVKDGIIFPPALKFKYKPWLPLR